MANPTPNIFLKDTPLTPPNASPFTPVAIGLIKAHVDEDPWKQAFQYKVKSASGYFQKGDGAI